MCIVLMHGGEKINRHGPVPLPLDLIFRWQDVRVSRLHRLARMEAADGNEALTRLGKIMEQIVRELLVEQGFWLNPLRELYYREGMNGHSFSRTRELDAVCRHQDDDGTPQYIMECRVSVRGIGSYHEEYNQLVESLRIMRRQWPNVRGFVTLVSLSPEPVLAWPNDVREPLAINEAWLQRAFESEFDLELVPHVPLAVLSLQSLIDWARVRQWWFHPTLLSHAFEFAARRWERFSHRHRIL